MLVDRKMPGGYLFLNERLSALRKELVQKYGADLIEAEENQNIYLNQTRLDSLNLAKQEVADYIAGQIRKWLREGTRIVLDLLLIKLIVIIPLIVYSFLLLF